MNLIANDEPVKPNRVDVGPNRQLLSASTTATLIDKFTKRGHCVLDMYDVLGTTAVQCMLSGRGCLSFDPAPAGIGANYIKRQAQAMRSASVAPPMFYPADSEDVVETFDAFWGGGVILDNVPQSLQPSKGAVEEET
jgi:hypothetical protein